MRTAIATCRPLPEPDPDEGPLLDALRARGVEARTIAWQSSDPADDPASFDACVIRSTWDYYRHPDEFARWIQRTSERTCLLNPAPVCLWNMHKGYLRELERKGVPIVPSAWCSRGHARDVAQTMDEQGWEGVVIKPQVSAASWRTRRFSREDAADAQAFLNELARERDAMIQQYLASVEHPGTRERSIVWIAGEFTHAIAKSARFDDQHESVSAASPPTPGELDLAQRVLNAIPFDLPDLLCARIDLMTGDDGTVLLSELELLEPSLFLIQHPPALSRLAQGIVRLATYRS